MQKSASFERNFSEYQISRAKLAEEFVILNDGKKDCEKSFDEMINLKKEEHISLAGLKIEDELVSSIKISISGYDENSDSLDFDLNLLSLSVPYRYAISNGCFEMSIFLKEDKEVVEKFLSTFSFVNESKIYEQTYM